MKKNLILSWKWMFDMAVNSKQKGARFERTIAKLFREHGFSARRGQQFSDANGDADMNLLGVQNENTHCK